MRPDIDFAARAIQGARDNQEDFHAFEPLASGGLLVVIADGVGGESSGEIASRVAVHGFLSGFAAPAESEAHRFPAALRRANRGVARAIAASPEGVVHMATTLLAAKVEKSEVHWISVGDSPLLLFRRGGLIQLNEDHSGKAERHEPGLGRHALASALTGGGIAIIDRPSKPYRLRAGDVLVAASDGLWTLTIEEIAAQLATHARKDAARIVVELLAAVLDKNKPHQDNVTIAVIKSGPAR